MVNDTAQIVATSVQLPTSCLLLLVADPSSHFTTCFCVTDTTSNADTLLIWFYFFLCRRKRDRNRGHSGRSAFTHAAKFSHHVASFRGPFGGQLRDAIRRRLRGDARMAFQPRIVWYLDGKRRFVLHVLHSTSSRHSARQVKEIGANIFYIQYDIR